MRFFILFLSACLFSPTSNAKIIYAIKNKSAMDKLYQKVTQNYNLPVFKIIYDQLSAREDLKFYVSTYTPKEINEGRKVKGNDYAPLGRFLAPNEKYKRPDPIIAFWYEENHPGLTTQCMGKFNLSTFDNREMVIFQEFAHAAQWMYENDLGIPLDKAADLRSEMEIELLSLIALPTTCVNEELLQNQAIKKFVTRYQSNNKFTQEDFNHFGLAIPDIFRSLLKMGPSYNKKYTVEHMELVKKEDFKFLYSLLGKPINP